jgi:hypothetical protein
MTIRSMLKRQETYTSETESSSATGPIQRQEEMLGPPLTPVVLPPSDLLDLGPPLDLEDRGSDLATEKPMLRRQLTHHGECTVG